MITVRHVMPNGDSSIFSALTVSHLHVRPDGAIAECIICHVANGMGPEDYEHCYQGSVYIMNDNGKTVGVFHLPSPSPEEQALLKAA